MTDERIEPDELLTTAEVAARLRVHQRTVQRWLTAGHLRAAKVGPKVWRIRQQDLGAFLAGGSGDVHNRDV